MKLKALSAICIAAGMGVSLTAHALPQIAFDPTGSAGGVGGANWILTDTWSDGRNTGVDEVLTTSAGGANPGTGFNPGDQHGFSGQVRVDSVTVNNGPPISIPGFNSNFELTKTYSFVDAVQSFNGTPGAPNSSVVFDHVQDNNTNLTVWFDDITDGTVSQAGDGAGTVNCYGATAATCNDINGFGGGFGGVDGDGIAIIEANLIENTSSFAFDNVGDGTGGFTLIFEITNFNPNYINLDNTPLGPNGLPIVSINFSGSLNLPLGGVTPSPVVMWDGRAVGGAGANNVPNTHFIVDSSETFVADTAVPVPGSLMLLGTGLIGLFGVSKRKTKA